MNKNLKNEICVFFSTKDIHNTKKLLNSILLNSLNTAENFYRLSIYIFDKTTSQVVKDLISLYDLKITVITYDEINRLEKLHTYFFHVANCNMKSDSIQRARIQQQVYIQENKFSFSNSIIWQVDDDMLFGKSSFSGFEHLVTYPVNYFSQLLEFYHNYSHLDAIISPSTYVPPIPSLLYSETQLKDLFYGRHEYSNILKPYEYHDFYNLGKENDSYPFFFSKTSKNNLEIVKRILIGEPITRASGDMVSNEVLRISNTSNLRGGNFIVFNIDIFSIPHIGYTDLACGVARRSDMIHSYLLSEMGFDIKDVNYFSLVHNRSFSGLNLMNSCDKYFTDMIGSLLVQFLYKGLNSFHDRLHFHRIHILSIISILKKHFSDQVISDELTLLNNLNLKINSVEEKCLIEHFKTFELKLKTIKKELCKLV